MKTQDGFAAFDDGELFGAATSIDGILHLIKQALVEVFEDPDTEEFRLTLLVERAKLVLED